MSELVKLQVCWQAQLVNWHQRCLEFLTINSIQIWYMSTNGAIKDCGANLKTLPIRTADSIDNYVLEGKEEERHCCLAVLGIPSSFPFQNFMEEHIGDMHNKIKQLKIVRSNRHDEYLVMLLIDKLTSNTIYWHLFGRILTPYQPHRLIIREVQSFCCDKSQLDRLSLTIMEIKGEDGTNMYNEFIFESDELDRQWGQDFIKCHRCHIFLYTIKQRKECTKGFPLTTFCGHHFHAECLKQEVCLTCKINLVPTQITFCDDCAEYDEVWLCLNCFGRFCSTLSYKMTKFTHFYQHMVKNKHYRFKSLRTNEIYDLTSSNFEDKCWPQALRQDYLVKASFINRLNGLKQQIENQKMKFNKTYSEADLKYSNQSEELIKKRDYLRLDIERAKVFQGNLQKLERQEEQVKKLEKELDFQTKVSHMFSERLMQLKAKQAHAVLSEVEAMESLNKKIKEAKHLIAEVVKNQKL